MKMHMFVKTSAFNFQEIGIIEARKLVQSSMNASSAY
jgi:hypothetical protein